MNFQKTLPFFYLLLAYTLTSCSFAPSAAEQLQFYQQGVKAFQKKKYTQSVNYLRQIPPGSSQYPKSVKILQKIPFQKGQDAFDQKKYPKAIQQLQKVPKNNPYLEQAQQLIILSKYQIHRLNYEQVADDQKESSLKKMIMLAQQAKDKELYADMVGLLGDRLQTIKNSIDLKRTVDLLLEMLQQTSSSALQQKSQTLLVDVFSQYASQPDSRNIILKALAQLKQMQQD